MDVKDVSHHEYYAAVLKNSRDAVERASRRKGQLVREHPHPQLLIARFMANIQPPGTSVKNGIHTTQVPAPYPPCVLPVSALRPLKISEMKLETHHRGRSVLLRVLTPPSRITAVMVIVEDERDTAVMLQLYHQDEESVVPASEVLRPGICIVKEPFFKCAVDGTYSVRIDHINDIVWLENSDERIPQKWRRQHALGAGSNDSATIRRQGNEAVGLEKWAEAERLYSSAIRAAETPVEEQLACLNRSLANLRLQRPEKALSDAARGGSNAASSEKSLFREARALYELGDFQKSLEKLQELLASTPGNATAGLEAARAETRLHEQNSGEYDFRRMYKEAKKTPPFIDCATFSAPVEVRDAPGKGRGLFTVLPVSAGQLLLCEKAFGYGYAEDNGNLSVLMNIVTKKTTIGGQARLLTQIIQKLHRGHPQSNKFKQLYCGEYTPVPVSEVEGLPVVDTFQVERIITLNGFGSPRTSQSSFMKYQDGKARGDDGEGRVHTTTGIWLQASGINHSCTGNCYRSFIGDMQIVRATRDMPADTELSFTYRPTEPLESYADVQKGLKNWGFTCECELCRDRMVTPKAVLERRKTLRGLFGRAVSGFVNVPKAFAALEKMEATYPATNKSPVRLELWDPYFSLGALLLTMDRPTDAVNMLVKGLESLGYSITAHPPGKQRQTPRLEVERWGLGHSMVPWAFLRLCEGFSVLAPELCGRAKDYAEVAYGILVGESETISETFPHLI